MQPITRRDWDHTISERRKGGIVKTAGVVVQARWTERRGDGFKRWRDQVKMQNEQHLAAFQWRCKAECRMCKIRSWNDPVFIFEPFFHCGGQKGLKLVQALNLTCSPQWKSIYKDEAEYKLVTVQCWTLHQTEMCACTTPTQCRNESHRLFIIPVVLITTNKQNVSVFPTDKNPPLWPLTLHRVMTH